MTATMISTPASRLADVTTRFAPIPLADLVDRAALLTRVDRKYVLPAALLPELMLRLPADSRVLEIDRRRVFGYRSTYLDTPDLVGFHAAGQRRRRRFKVRTRCYLDSGTCWLEVKTRAGRNLTIKERIPHPDAEDGPLTEDGLAFVAARLRAAQVDGVRPDQLQPAMITAYHRSTVLLSGTGGRVTTDVDLGWTSVRSGHRGDLDRPGLVIIETKTGSTPSAADRLLWSMGRRPIRISKYAVGMAALDPSLPRLKWARTLRRDVQIHTTPERLLP